jgi:Domain of unknown function (DUF4338)
MFSEPYLNSHGVYRGILFSTCSFRLDAHPKRLTTQAINPELSCSRLSEVGYGFSECSRFLVLPWVHIPGLASKILAHRARQVPNDWERRYGYRPLLLETLVYAQRFRGICYRAANWIRVGQTQGRGRMDREHRADGLVSKDIYLYPLRRNVQRELCHGPLLTHLSSSNTQTR